MVRLGRSHRAAPERPAWEEHPVAAGRPLTLADLTRQSACSRLAGYEGVNDAERLSQDPAFRLIGSRKIWERGVALTSRVQSFEAEILTQTQNLAGLAAVNGELLARTQAIAPRRRDSRRRWWPSRFGRATGRK